jgi:hypothetical protein
MLMCFTALSTLQADLKEVLQHTALLFSPPGGQSTFVDSLSSNAAGTASGPELPAEPSPAQGASPLPHAAEVATKLNMLALRAVKNLIERGERELDLLASEFDFQPQQKILAREVQSRALQVHTLALLLLASYVND